MNALLAICGSGPRSTLWLVAVALLTVGIVAWADPDTALALARSAFNALLLMIAACFLVVAVVGIGILALLCFCDWAAVALERLVC